MGVNLWKPHIFIIPEDSRDAEIANGFWAQVPGSNSRQLQIFHPAGGWLEVKKLFLKSYAPAMFKNQYSNCILLIDFDHKVPERIQEFRESIPIELRDRVFILGCLGEPEDLKRNHPAYSFELLGSELAKESSRGEDGLWNTDQLIHNTAELDRLCVIARPILFP